MPSPEFPVFSSIRALLNLMEGKTSKTQLPEEAYFYFLSSKPQVVVINQRYKRLDERLEAFCSRTDASNRRRAREAGKLT